MDVKERKGLDKFLGNHVKVTLKDNFIKDGIFEGYDDLFIFLKFRTGENISISLSNIKEIKDLDGGGER